VKAGTVANADQPERLPAADGLTVARIRPSATDASDCRLIPLTSQARRKPSRRWVCAKELDPPYGANQMSARAISSSPTLITALT
jgi:hypothetical protein